MNNTKNIKQKHSTLTALRHSTLTALSPAFGTYKLNPIQEWARKNAIKYTDKNKLVASMFRKIARLKRKKGPVDIIPFGTAKVRIYLKGNAPDKQMMMGTKGLGISTLNMFLEITKKIKNHTIIFVDIGANSGAYSVLFNHAAQQNNKNIDVIAVEPIQNLIPRIKFNLKASGIQKFEVFECAVSDQNKNLEFYVADSLNISKVQKQKTDKTISVKARTLMSILEEAGTKKIDFLKIDIEGHEIPALTPFFQNAPKTLMPEYILAETFFDKNNELSELIQKYGYTPKQKTKLDTLFVRKNEDSHNRKS